MSRFGTFLAFAGLAAGVGAGGYWAGQRDLSVLAVMRNVQAVAMRALGGEAAPMTSPGSVLYYRHPDGDPIYSATPKQTDDGRDFTAVRAGEDVSFDEPGKADMTAVEANSGEREVLYYRNPMGLPDRSPTPKKDSMGMDYIPVYAGENDDSATVKVSAGKQQRTGVKTVLATKSAIVRPVRVPGTVTLDERRVSVVSIRTEAFLEEVADITTGQMIEQGEPLVRFYAKEIAAAGALYAADLKSGAGKGAAGGSLQRLENLGVPAEAIAEIEKTRTRRH